MPIDSNEDLRATEYICVMKLVPVVCDKAGRKSRLTFKIRRMRMRMQIQAFILSVGT